MGAGAHDAARASRPRRAIFTELAGASRAHHRYGLPRPPGCRRDGSARDVYAALLELPTHSAPREQIAQAPCTVPAKRLRGQPTWHHEGISIKKRRTEP